jgi:uncharacterized protein YcbK (DUF882 family)
MKINKNTKFVIYYALGLGVVYVLVRQALKRVNVQTEITEGKNEVGENHTKDEKWSGGVPKSKYFNISEFHSNDGVEVPEKYYGNLQKLMTNLDVLREYLGSAIFINSGYRSPAHNKKVGGVSNSQHLYAIAADMRSLTKTPKEIKAAIETLIAQGKMSKGGVGLYSTFVHYDVRGTNARWSK